MLTEPTRSLLKIDEYVFPITGGVNAIVFSHFVDFAGNLQSQRRAIAPSFIALSHTRIRLT